MTQSVPDSFNMDELSAMLENAPLKMTFMLQLTTLTKSFTPEVIEDIANDALELATEQVP